MSCLFSLLSEICTRAHKFSMHVFSAVTLFSACHISGGVIHLACLSVQKHCFAAYFSVSNTWKLWCFFPRFTPDDVTCYFLRPRLLLPPFELRIKLKPAEISHVIQDTKGEIVCKNKIKSPIVLMELWNISEIYLYYEWSDSSFPSNVWTKNFNCLG